MDKKQKFLSNRLRLDKISELLAEDILSDNIISKDKIITKSKIYFVFWQRLNSFPKKDEVTYELKRNSVSFHILKLFIKENFCNSSEIEYQTKMQKFFDLQETLEYKIEDLKTEQ
jgi:hypothetical protein